MRLLLLPIVATALLLSNACSAGRSYEAAKRGVDTFHSQLNAGNFDRILVNASQHYRDVMTVETNRKLFSAIHRRLGDAGAWSVQGWNVNVTTSGTFLRLQCKTTFTQGKVDEAFVWRVSGDTATLVRYSIKSLAVISELGY